MFVLDKTDPQSCARRGRLITPHGTIETPVFMNVATCAAIKGGLSAFDLKEVNCQVMLSNTYHLHISPGRQAHPRPRRTAKVYRMGQTHTYGQRRIPGVLTRKPPQEIKEEGVYFASHIDGKRIFMGPEQSMQIQSHLGSTIAMAFDECIENPAEYNYVKNSCDRTTRWLLRCKTESEQTERT